MSVWQNTGIIVWSLPLSDSVTNIASKVIFWTFMTLTNVVICSFGGLEFFGVKQIFQKSEEVSLTEEAHGELLTTGIYGLVRHPMCTCLMCAFLFAPKMSLDRLWIFVLTSCYLRIGLYYEEKKLIQAFGKDYLEYRKKVPALIPKLII